MKVFENKVAVVTGAASGIGLSLARHCLGLGMRVVLADINASALSEACADLPGPQDKIRPHTLDVSDAMAVKAFAEEVYASLGAVHLLFNNAGVIEVGPAWAGTSDAAERLLKINVLGVLHGLQSFVPRMIAQDTPCRIINTASAAVVSLAAPSLGLYTASKMAVRGLTETLRVELQALDASVGVSMLCPGPVLTGMTAPASTDTPEHAAMRAAAGELQYMDPNRVAEITFEAIQADRFWIITHPELLEEGALPEGSRAG